MFRRYGIFYLITFLVLLGIKYFYSKAGSDELLWILTPTTGWVSILSGIPFRYEAGMGYVNHALRYVIAPSCSGVQFMLITIATLIFSFIHRVNQKLRPYWTFGSIVASYFLTIMVNGLRILCAIYIPLYLQDVNIYHAFLTPSRIHTMIGTGIYFIALLIIHRIAGYVAQLLNTSANEKPSVPKCVTPIFWYFFIVLGIPLLNNAYSKNPMQFAEYAILIILVCSGILLLYFPIAICSRWVIKRHKS